MPTISYEVNKCLRLHYYVNKRTGEQVHRDYRIDLADADWVQTDLIEEAQKEAVLYRGKPVVKCPSCKFRIIPWAEFDSFVAGRGERDAIPLATCTGGVQIYTYARGFDGARVQVSLE